MFSKHALTSKDKRTFERLILTSTQVIVLETMSKNKNLTTVSPSAFKLFPDYKVELLHKFQANGRAIVKLYLCEVASNKLNSKVSHLR